LPPQLWISNGIEEEKTMTQKIGDQQIRAGAFNTVGEADLAIRRLLAAGFSRDQLAVVCPVKFQEHFGPEVHQSETPSGTPGQALATGGAVGVTLGGLALVATVIMTGGVGAVAVAALIGGGALAGAFSSLIVSKGYEEEADDYFKKAIEHGQIVVGIEIPGEDSIQLLEAQRILDEAGAKMLEPV
jgi:hypothetical protein